MYTHYFGYSENPFTLTPNPRFIFLSNKHKEAFAHLLYGIDNHHGFIKLVGEVGTGKTTLLRTLLGQLGEDKYRTALIFNPCISGIELLRSINHEYGIRSDYDNVSDLLSTLNQFLLAENGQGHTVVLVIDEAQNLQPEVLEHIRLISNLETENDKLIQIILAGQPELKALLKKSELRQLNQRIAVRYTLKPMTREETGRYIRHRTDRASETGGEFFSSNAILPIHLYTGGNPRMINILCDRALLVAYSNEQRVITASTVLKPTWERKGLPGNLQGSEAAGTGSSSRDNHPPASEERQSGLTEEAAEQIEAFEDSEPLELLEEVATEDGAFEESYDLGAELRMEMNEYHHRRIKEMEVPPELQLLQSMTTELINPHLPGDVLLLVLRFAAEFFNRGVIFMVRDKIISGHGQFGIGNGDGNGDETVRSIHFSLETGSMFRPPCKSGKPLTFTPDLTGANISIFNQLGGGIPEQAFIGPLVSRSRIIGFLYADNLPDNKTIERTETLEIFLSQAGVALEKNLLEKKLNEGKQV